MAATVRLGSDSTVATARPASSTIGATVRRGRLIVAVHRPNASIAVALRPSGLIGVVRHNDLIAGALRLSGLIEAMARPAGSTVTIGAETAHPAVSMIAGIVPHSDSIVVVRQRDSIEAMDHRVRMIAEETVRRSALTVAVRRPGSIATIAAVAVVVVVIAPRAGSTAETVRRDHSIVVTIAAEIVRPVPLTVVARRPGSTAAVPRAEVAVADSRNRPDRAAAAHATEPARVARTTRASSSQHFHGYPSAGNHGPCSDTSASCDRSLDTA